MRLGFSMIWVSELLNLQKNLFLVQKNRVFNTLVLVFVFFIDEHNFYFFVTTRVLKLGGCS